MSISIVKSMGLGCLLFILATPMQAQNQIDLSGEWRFAMDPGDDGEVRQVFTTALSGKIHLPGSMPEYSLGEEITLATQWTGSIYDSSFFFNPELEKFRQPGQIHIPFWLTPKKHYVGPAWYQKDVVIPEDWQKKRIVLFLERPHWETLVWVDNKKVEGMQNSMTTAHEYELTRLLPPGKHTLTIRVDNRIKEVNVGIDSHSVTDHTQGNWNGIVGKIALVSKPKAFIASVDLYPNIQTKKVKAVVAIDREAGDMPIRVELQARPFHLTDSFVGSVVRSSWSSNDTIILEYNMGKDARLWDEFDPALYSMSVRITGKGIEADQKNDIFGLREFKQSGQQFLINGRPVVLRGTVENCQFPKTGYPAMDVEEWERIFKVCRSFGLNHMRFHSYCPPEAAFIAADKTGFYLQPEGPSWANHGSSIGDGRPIDQYIYDETNRMVQSYGNHPSFCMMAYGNEPKGRNHLRYLSEFVTYWKKKDSRRLYTSASIGMSAWKVTPESEFIVRSGARGINWKGTAETLFDYSKGDIANWNVPYVAHEMGQYCVFPNFKEIPKYTGVMRARNFEMFREILKDHDMGDQAHDFMMASGKLQTLCYKMEIEASLRTFNGAGFQLLGLNDFSGQGSAIVGMVDSFWDEKGYVTAGEFRRFCSEVTPLARISKFVYTNNEMFEADILVSNHGKSVMPDQLVEWKVTDEKGKQLASGSFRKFIGYGNGLPLGVVRVGLSEITSACKLNLEVKINGFANDWNFWVYPEVKEIPALNNVYVCDFPDEKMFDQLKQGGKVLLLSGEKVVRGKEVVQYFKPVFWNTSWFKMRPPHTTGILIKDQHPCLKDFPTEYYSDLNWFDISERQRVMELGDFPSGFRTIVQPIDTWFLSRRLAMLFEARVGNGRLMVCSMDLKNNLDKRLSARQFLISLTNYLNSDQFQPKEELSPEHIIGLFTEAKKRSIEINTKDAPDEIKFNILTN